MHWVTGTLHATTLLSGLGMAEIPEATAAKLFASLFALYAGFVFLATVATLMAPIIHRFLHYFHWEERRSEDEGE
ncbi:hypothetical protein KUV26_20520 [Leisingera daeponensis]|uniref:Potassium channel domain-containing protein n=1 Tax=Leisingera daeponensis TaxID=405746 RepID=A0ABS7NKT9_9RHOB|nr:hypothetical protein [Leisingera daeponensis]MBY6141829.1 hypothetical protein [Leisingera daeponensis]